MPDPRDRADLASLAARVRRRPNDPTAAAAYEAARRKYGLSLVAEATRKACHRYGLTLAEIRESVDVEAAA